MGRCCLSRLCSEPARPGTPPVELQLQGMLGWWWQPGALHLQQALRASVRAEH